MTKSLALLSIAILLSSCQAPKTFKIDPAEVEDIQIFQIYPEVEFEIREGAEQEFISAIAAAKDVGPTKFRHTHQVLFFRKGGDIDTVLTNGVIHRHRSWYKSNEDLVAKYFVEKNVVLSDTIAGQLQTAEKLMQHMKAKQYEQAIQLFSNRQVENIREIQRQELFDHWTFAWTLNQSQYKHFQSRIKAGRGRFVFEDGMWKIDEK